LVPLTSSEAIDYRVDLPTETVAVLEQSAMRLVISGDSRCQVLHCGQIAATDVNRACEKRFSENFELFTPSIEEGLGKEQPVRNSPISPDTP
jgi:hypothetical protein